MSYNRTYFITGALLLAMAFNSCTEPTKPINVKVYQSDQGGNKLANVPLKSVEKTSAEFTLDANQTFQTIEGFGGAFTESSAYLLNQVSEKNRKEIIQSYFGDEGARYSLCRTHINSSDFSLGHYAYDTIPGDTTLSSFSLREDEDDVIPFIQEAQEVSRNGFKIIASPWTAPPWMKDNDHWHGGKLKKEYYGTWAKYFSLYANEMEKRDIPIWAFTFENEPLGNNANWESMHYTPQEMMDFVKNHLHPTLKANQQDIHLLMYDQNKGKELDEWAEVYLQDPEFEPYFYGTAVHWYNSTFSFFPESLEKTHALNPQKPIIQTEACIDAEKPVWKNDAKYWTKYATDWGYDWAKEEEKYLHPKYAPVHRLAGDIIGSLNHWVTGWVDWNLVLDTMGGPNHAKNWCTAPVIVNPETDEVYYTPLYYIMSHFSRFIVPGAQRIDLKGSHHALQTVAVKNPDNSVVMVIFNPSEQDLSYAVYHNGTRTTNTISSQAIQTLVFNP